MIVKSKLITATLSYLFCQCRQYRCKIMYNLNKSLLFQYYLNTCSAEHNYLHTCDSKILTNDHVASQLHIKQQKNKLTDHIQFLHKRPMCKSHH